MQQINHLNLNGPNIASINPTHPSVSSVFESRPIASSPTLRSLSCADELVNRAQNNLIDSSKPSMVHKWNLVFDGSKEGINIDRFLYRVESNASTYGIPEYRLLNDIQFLLKRKALNWYWSHREAKRPSSWAEFRNAISRQFSSEQNDFEIRQRIGDRKQKNGESFQDFCSAISEMTLSLVNPFSDYDFTLILYGNMRPGLKEKLAGRKYDSSSALFEDCVHIENVWRSISFVPERQMGFTPSRPILNPVDNRNVVFKSPQYKQVHEMQTYEERM